MQGGTVVLATSPFNVGLQGRLAVTENQSGLEDWLASHGLGFARTLVLDPQNAAFPVPMERQVGGYTVQETHLLNYPYFVDIRHDGMHRDSGLLTGIDQLSLTWASPVTVDAEKNRERQVVRLLESSPGSWTSPSFDIQPDFERYGETGFATGTDTGRQLLGVLVEGRFDSPFRGRPSPLVEAARRAQAERDKAAAGQEGGAAAEPEANEPEQVLGKVLERSPESARIILLASNTFLADTSLELASGAAGSRYLNPLQLVANAIDWSLADRDLLSIRGRGHFARTLVPMAAGARAFWEYLNYGLAAAGLVVVWGAHRLVLARTRRRERQLVAGEVEA
jgi:ABC-2 type transport system permease protein